MEEKFFETLMVKEHLFVLLGIFCVILLIKWGGDKNPVGKFLFSDTWKWLVAPLNVALSSIGIFALKLTSFESTSMKLMAMLIISAFATYSYELLKYPINNIIGKVMGKKPDDLPPTTPVNPAT